MNIANNFTNYFTANNNYQTFIIYELDALNATNDAELSDFEAISFDSAFEYEYSNAVDIPYQPLEGGSYSTDSVLDNPFLLPMVGVITNAYDNNTVANSFNDLDDIVTTLTQYLQQNTRLVIFKKQPFFTTYAPLHLKSFNYQVSPDKTALWVKMLFQEARTTADNSTSNDVIKNKSNTSIYDNGIIEPINNITPQQ